MQNAIIILLLLFFTTAASASASGPVRQPDAESERVELVARMEQSVAIIDVTAREVRQRQTAVVIDEGPAIASGVLLTSDGVILTAGHVVNGASKISVRFMTGSSQTAEVIFIDATTDIALLRVPSVPTGILPARLGDSDGLRKGQTVYIIGNPIGVEFSLSTGVISGRHPIKHLFADEGELEMIQTDATMNAGNSGGPMFNSRGEVIAIAQRILTSSGGSEGLGFGIAINDVRKVLTSDPCLWLGFSAVPLNEEWAAALNVTEGAALLVQAVSPGSPAEKSGLRGGSLPVRTGEAHLLLGGDVILRIDGTPIADWKRTSWPVMAEGTRHQLVVTVLRAGQVVDLTVDTIHRKAVVDELVLRRQVPNAK